MQLETIDEETGLVSSGLIDSLALLEIINYLESEYNINFAARGVDPEELSSVSRILTLVENCVE